MGELGKTVVPVERTAEPWELVDVTTVMPVDCGGGVTMLTDVVTVDPTGFVVVRIETLAGGVVVVDAGGTGGNVVVCEVIMVEPTESVVV